MQRRGTIFDKHPAHASTRVTRRVHLKHPSASSRSRRQNQHRGSTPQDREDEKVWLWRVARRERLLQSSLDVRLHSLWSPGLIRLLIEELHAEDVVRDLSRDVYEHCQSTGTRTLSRSSWPLGAAGALTTFEERCVDCEVVESPGGSASRTAVEHSGRRMPASFGVRGQAPACRDSLVP